MPLNGGYHYAMELFRKDGTCVDRYPVTPDWVPAKEWCHFLGIRRGTLPPVLSPISCRIEPNWHATLGAPYVDGIRVIPEGDNGSVESENSHMATDIPHSYFYGTFQHLSATLVKQGTLQPGEHVRFLVYAFPETLIPSQHTPQPLGRFVIQEVSQPLSLVTSSLAYFQQNSQFMDQETSEPRTDTDPPVFFHPPVLDEAVSLAKAAGELETGGILIGHLHRDDSSGEIYLEVTAQIAAVHTQAQRTSLSFTPETWTAVRTALTLRKKNEGWLGWWHSHPNFCKNCPPEKQRTCSLSQPFFSQEDLALHREIFPRAFNIALLITNRGPSGFATTVFGWRQGMISARHYAVLNQPLSSTVRREPCLENTTPTPTLPHRGGRENL